MVSTRAKWKIADEEADTKTEVVVTIEGQTKKAVDSVYEKLIKTLGEPERRRRM